VYFRAQKYLETVEKYPRNIAAKVRLRLRLTDR